MSTETEKDLERQIEEHEEAIAEYQKLQRIKTNKVADLRTSLKVIRETPKFRPMDICYYHNKDYGQRSLHAKILVNSGHLLPYDSKGCDIDLDNDYHVIANLQDLWEQAGPGGVIVAFTKDEAYFMIDDIVGGEWAPIYHKVQAALDRQK